ncbi:Hint domain-containing protein [Profundibacterium mesophilum]|uniref:Hint domain protein n=1 Tax=Profundibacterium mesophilum KAUST100406-0324 TaxID=1037889 RepID=A0A921NU71_9RHOB|nr:Hint domain-containing protein [Profundibacterium mesophilum]KAF0674844.1 Hint domain protein [Profundibacterium mesophilum KAUST100406-0324]
MSFERQIDQDPAYSLAVLRAAGFVAIDGANLGDPIGPAFELSLGDVYMLSARRHGGRLGVAGARGDAPLAIAAGSDLGRVGAPLHLDCCATFMTPDGATVEALILVELDGASSLIAEVYVYPLARLRPKREYSLVAIDRDGAPARLAELACVSFTRGTHITMASGRQIPIERITPGDSVLTRDHGAQKVRWIGHHTVRAVGDLAPIRINKGVLHNENALIVSPNHRLFVYQRQDRAKAGAAEILVKAKYLIDGDTITRTDGGFVDYFQILFDRHELIFAEGIAAESLMIDTRTRQMLPADLRLAYPPQLSERAPGRTELSRKSLDRANAASLLRAASTG